MNEVSKTNIFDNKRLIWTLVTLCIVWVSTVVMSFFSPDLISGSQQEHLPLVLWTAWIWGILASAIILRMFKEKTNYDTHMFISIAIMVLWGVLMLVGVFAPPYVTGSDPTSIPFASVFSPFLGFILTLIVWFLSKPT